MSFLDLLALARRVILKSCQVPNRQLIWICMSKYQEIKNNIIILI